MDKNLQEKLIAFAEKGHTLIGLTIQVEQALSTNKDNFERHFTASSRFNFNVEHFGIRFSGNKMQLSGGGCEYEIHSDKVTSFTEIGNKTYVFSEKLSEPVCRRSVLKFIP